MLTPQPASFNLIGVSLACLIIVSAIVFIGVNRWKARRLRRNALAGTLPPFETQGAINQLESWRKLRQIVLWSCVLSSTLIMWLSR